MAAVCPVDTVIKTGTKRTDGDTKMKCHNRELYHRIPWGTTRDTTLTRTEPLSKQRVESITGIRDLIMDSITMMIITATMVSIMTKDNRERPKPPEAIPGPLPPLTQTLPKCVRCTMRTISELLPRRPIINQNLQVSLFHSKSLNLMKKTCHLKRITPKPPCCVKPTRVFKNYELLLLSPHIIPFTANLKYFSIICKKYFLAFFGINSHILTISKNDQMSMTGSMRALITK